MCVCVCVCVCENRQTLSDMQNVCACVCVVCVHVCERETVTEKMPDEKLAFQQQTFSNWPSYRTSLEGWSEWVAAYHNGTLTIVTFRSNVPTLRVKKYSSPLRFVAQNNVFVRTDTTKHTQKLFSVDLFSSLRAQNSLNTTPGQNRLGSLYVAHNG